MKKQEKKDLMVLGGIIAGVVILALGAFALNPQGGVYKGALTVTDEVVKVTSDDRTVTEAEVKIEEDSEVEKQLEDPKLELITIEKPPTPPATSPNQEWPSAVPLITGYTPTPNTNFLPSNYGTNEKVVYFDIIAHGSEYAQTDPIYLYDLHVDYRGCLGDAYLNPKTTPRLILRNGGAVLATDYNRDGVFSIYEFDSASATPYDYTDKVYDLSLNSGLELAIEMEVDSTMCPSGAAAVVVVSDVLWSNVDGEYHLYDPAIPNELVDGYATGNLDYRLLY